MRGQNLIALKWDWSVKMRRRGKGSTDFWEMEVRGWRKMTLVRTIVERMIEGIRRGECDGR